MNDMAMNQLWATQQAKLDEKDAEIERLLTKNEKEKNLLLTVLDKQTTEIERLKAEYLKLDERLEQALRKNENQATLITELADAFERYKLLWDGDAELIQRAREATRG
jgi:hypothetical protein